MPQAVSAFVEQKKQFEECDFQKRNILKIYRFKQCRGIINIWLKKYI